MEEVGTFAQERDRPLIGWDFWPVIGWLECGRWLMRNFEVRIYK